MIELTSEQLGRLLFKAMNEPRRAQKRYLRDMGGEGTAEELDSVLAVAERDKAAVKESHRLEQERHNIASEVEQDYGDIINQMLADIRAKMDEEGLTQSELGQRCGWTQPVVSAYLSGRKLPGMGNLAKIAKALGGTWRLKENLD